MHKGPPIIIAGMPHSGSSFLADRLHAAGVQMHNGEMCEHFECQHLVRLSDDEQKRSRTGFDKSGAPRYRPSPEFVSALRDYRRQRELIQSPLPYGFKEPRITAYLEAYIQVWPDALYIWAIRNPLRAGQTRIRRMRREVTDPEIMAKLPNIVELLHNQSAAMLYAMRCVMQYRLAYPYFYERDTPSVEEQVQQEKELSEIVGVNVELAAHWSPDSWGKSGQKQY